MAGAISSRSTGLRALIAFVAACLAFAGVVGWAVVLRPAVAVARASRWAPAQCTVLAGGVRRLSDRAYELDLEYEWQWQGRAFRGRRYDFFSLARESPEAWAPELGRLRPGQNTHCYVDPGRPAEATIERGWQGGVAGPGLALALFLLPTIGLFYALARRHEPTVASAGRIRSGALGVVPPGPRLVPLRPASTPARRGARAVVVAVFWNLVTGIVFAVAVLPGWRDGRPSWPLTLFVGAFAVMGLAQIQLAVRAALALANPRVQVRATGSVARLGEPFTVGWTFDRRGAAVTGVTLSLVGTEIARSLEWGADHQQREHEEKAVFLRASFPAAGLEGAWSSGEGRLVLPVRVPPTLAAAHNEIVWAIVLRATIRRRPDLVEEYRIELRPAAGAA